MGIQSISFVVVMYFSMRSNHFIYWLELVEYFKGCTSYMMLLHVVMVKYDILYSLYHYEVV